jgi:hypothetical protein
MIELIPIVLVAFKVLVLGTGMFFAIKWHYDQGEKTTEKRALLRATGKVTGVFLLTLVVLLYVTLLLGRKLGLDLPLS